MCPRKISWRRMLSAERLEARFLLDGAGLPPASAAPLVVAELGTAGVAEISGILNATFSQHAHILQVTASQSQYFELEVPSGDPSLVVTATIYNSAGNVLLNLAASPGAPAAGSLLLLAGSYSVVVQYNPVSGGSAGYALEWQGQGTYLGPQVIDPSGSPIGPSGDVLEEFGFPDTLISSDTLIWVGDELEAVADPASFDPTSVDDFWWEWYAEVVDPLISE